MRKKIFFTFIVLSCVIISGKEKVINLEEKNVSFYQSAPRWENPSLDDSEWKFIKVPAMWREAGEEWEKMKEWGWYRIHINIPSEWKGKNLKLELGKIFYFDRTYFNGEFIGEQRWGSSTRNYKIPSTIVNYGKDNVLAVRVLGSFMRAGVGGITSGPNIIYPEGEKHNVINLDTSAGGKWKFKSEENFLDKWEKENFDDSKWEKVKMKEISSIYENYGYGLCRLFIHIPSMWKKQNLVLNTGNFRGFVILFVNGEMIGQLNGLKNSKFVIPSKFIKYGGNNLLAIRFNKGMSPWISLRGPFFIRPENINEFISLEINPKSPDGLFFRDEPHIIKLTANNLTKNEQKFNLKTVVFNTWDKKRVFSRSQKVILNKNQTKEIILDFSKDNLNYGHYKIEIEAEDISGVLKKVSYFSILPRPSATDPKDSMFGVNGGFHKGWSERYYRLGVKIIRTHFLTHVQGKANKKISVTTPPQFEWEKMDKLVREGYEHNLSFLPIIGYSPWGTKPAPPGVKRSPHGPPRDFDEFAEQYAAPTAAHYPEIKYWEIWNEPWIHGWTWHGSSQEFRELLKKTYLAIKKVRPDAQVLCGHSMPFLNDIIAIKGYEKYMDGDTSHPYGNLSYHYRNCNWQKILGEKYGYKTHWITEDGFYYGKNIESRRFPIQIIQRYLDAGINGIRTLCWHTDYEPGMGGMGLVTPGHYPTLGAPIYAVLSHLIDGKKFVRELFTESEILVGGIFVDKENSEKVAILLNKKYGLMNEDKIPFGKDKVKIKVQNGIEILDCLGNPIIGKREGDEIEIPFIYPFYIKTNLDLNRFIKFLKSVKVIMENPFNIRVLSLPSPVEFYPFVKVEITNLANYLLNGKVKISIPGWKFKRSIKNFEISSGEVTLVTFKPIVVKKNEKNLYPVRIIIKIGKQKIRKAFLTQVAYIHKITPKIDGSLSDWGNKIPVSIDSKYYENYLDLARYLLNPHLKIPGKKNKKRIKAKIYAGYDNKNFYFAAEIKEPSFSQKASVGPDDYSMLWYGGDAIQIGFALDKKNPWGYRNEPTKGVYVDTHYEYILAKTKDKTNVVVRLRSPETPLRDFYPENDDWKFFCPLSEAKIVVKRNEDKKITYYEVSIPWKELKNIKFENLKDIKFSFIIRNDEGIGKLEWGEVVGLPEYLSNPLSFIPFWEGSLPCQAKWGIEK